MGLLSFFKKSPDAPHEAPPTGDPVAQARVRARRRLIGAALLVGAGIVGFPLLFETQPRPINVDLPVIVPRKDAVPPLTPPKARPQAAAPTESAEPPVPAGSAARSARPESVITETRADAGREVPAQQAASAASPAKAAAASAPETRAAAPAAAASRTAAAAPRPEKAVDKAPEKPADKPVAKVAPKPEPKPEPKPDTRAEDAERARALLEGRDLAGSGRAVVQVGAYADAGAARDVRQRVEKLGLKTYTQVVDTGEGKRIRVRIGPFDSRDEADKAMAKLKAAGLSAAVLTL